ncbi:MAG TPA: WG repeat-containing protein, partial [Segetibacter sp.]
MKYFYSFCLLLFILLETSSQNLIPFRNAKGLWGYKDAAGNIVVKPKYQFEAHEFSNGVAIVLNSGLKGYGVIDSKGNEVVPPQYNVAYDFVNGLSKVCVGGRDIYGTGGKWGFIDTKGNVVIPIRYKTINGEFEGDSYARATMGDEWGIIIDKTGKEIRFNTCDQLYGTFYKSNLALAIKDKKYGFVNKTGKVIIPFEYERLYPFSNGLAAALKDKEGKWGFIDEKNNWVIKPQFSSGASFDNGFSVMNKDYKAYGCIDKTGKTTIPFEYDFIYPITKVSTPLVAVKKNGKIGFMNPITGKVIMPLKYDELQDFVDGLASVKLGEKYGYINALG